MSRVERPRNIALERALSRMAHQAGGVHVPLEEHAPTSLDVYAERRAHPGGVMVPRSFMTEAAEELADCRSYLLWQACEHYEGYLAGDLESCERFEHAMRVLAAVARAWHELTTLPG